MSAIFQGICSKCGYESPMASGCWAIIVDKPATGLGVDPENSRVVRLMHPLEDSIIASTGFTLRSAFREGRLLDIEKVFCASCGRLYETRRLRGREPFWTALGLSVGAGVLFGYLRSGVWVGLLAWAVSLMVFGSVMQRLSTWRVRRKWAERAREFEVERRCPSCGSTKCRRPKGWLPRRLPCPECGKRTMAVKMTAIS